MHHPDRPGRDSGGGRDRGRSPENLHRSRDLTAGSAGNHLRRGRHSDAHQEDPKETTEADPQASADLDRLAANELEDSVGERGRADLRGNEKSGIIRR